MNAPNIVFGIGSPGIYLNHSTLNTYLSTDGARTWRLIMMGTSTFEIGDRGRVLVVAPDS
jgi:hypothetical protein